MPTIIDQLSERWGGFPKWLVDGPDGHFYADPDIFYPAYFKELGVKEPTQYWVEVAYQCMKLDVMAVAHRRNLRVPTIIKVVTGDGRKARWTLKAFPKGRGSDAATKGKEARKHYIKIRGYIPNASY